jgi:hypothetical protein
MRALILLAGAALALGACNKTNDDAAINADVNMGSDTTMTGDQNVMVDANGVAGPGGADANMSTNTQEEMNKDMTTNDKDTNLANGI